MKGNFQKLINGSKPVLIDFYADWCGPCKTLSPIIKGVAGEMGEQIRVLKMNVDKNQSIAARYNVRGVPTLILFRNGEILWRQSGVLSKQQIVGNINTHLS